MEIVNSIAAKISEYAIDRIVHQLGYLVHYNRNIKDFEKQAEDLEWARARVKGLIDDAEKQGETIYEHVLTQLTEVDKITEDIKERDFPNVSCFNLFQRYRSSREAKNLRDELAEFEKKLDNLDKVGYRGPLPWMESDQGELSFESRTLIMDDIIKALKDPHIFMIGVYGMGGIGKTTLVDKIASQLSKSKLFEPVIMAVVGQNPQVNNIQGQLADKLGFGFKEETEQGRADSLRNRLLKEDKILIIIDDVWNGLDFKKVGIPIPSTNNPKGSKIIVTSRSLSILFNDMSIEKNFNVEDLTEDESWNLFKNQVGESIETNNQFKKIATQIANKCGKLPLALVLVAKALKGKDLDVWKDALLKLNNPGEGIHGVSKEAYTSIRLSYDHIESREAKTLFLLCTIFPDDYNIDVDDLSRYAKGLGFLNCVHTLEATRNRIVKLIDDLKSSCLLQQSEPAWDGHQRVKMHDVIRDVAINIASNDDQMCTLSYGKGLNKVQDEKTDRHYTAIFANCVNFKNLPEELNFSKLKLLTLLDDYDYSLQIPEDCFERMRNLEVLHLKGMSFSPSPSSFNHLAKLRTLLLIDCHVENIDMIGKLKDLEILDFSKSDIKELPLSFSQLSRLKQLKVSECEQLEVIQPGVISRMIKLEELFLDDIFNDWGVGEFNNCEQKKANVSISELGSLRCLTCLYLCIPDVRSLPEIQSLNNLELERFQIAIGNTVWDDSNYDSEKMLDIKTNSRNDVWKELQLLERCEKLHLEGRWGVRNVVSKLKTSVHLRYLTLKDNEDVEYIVSELDDPNHDDAFSILETLTLWSMRRLEAIINEGYSFKTFKVFEKLKTLEVLCCDKMKYLFPVSIIEGLSNLQSIRIQICEMMEAIVVVIENEAPVNNKMEFRRLRHLELRYLRKLKSFCGKLQKAKGLIESKSSEIVELKEEEEDRANSITPFHCQVSFPSLKSLEIHGVNNLEVILHNRLILDDMSNLQSVKLENCESLKSIFTSNVMSALKRLDELHIRNCDSLEQVFEIHQMIEPKEHREVASINLRKLVLHNLPSLKHVWSNDPFDEMYQFQDLNEVEVTKCPKLITLFPPSMARDLPHHLQCLQSDFDLERAKEEAQTLESVLVLEDNDFVIGKDRAKIPVSTLVGRNILFYFSADSSSAFLPKLIEAYHKIKENNDTFEVIFISSDRDESSFDQIFSRMPWLALPFGDPREASVSHTFKVQSLPMLVAIGSDGRTVTKDVIDLIRIHGAEAYPFTAGRVGELETEKEEIAKRGSEKVKHTLHEEHELVLSHRKRYICDGCNKEGRLWSYVCKECDFDLHPNCALEK